MKISLITLHRVTNFGSLLQTYATQTSLEKMGHEVEVIDYVPEGLSFYRSVWPEDSSIIKKLIKLIPIFIVSAFQWRMSDNFLKKNIKLTAKRYKNFSELENNCPNADIYISGSDQVWNTQNNNPEADLGGYYLAFTKAKNKIAFSGSFGKDDFDEKEKQRICNWLKDYKAISVREDTALQTLENFGFSGTHVVDPTLLLKAEDWKAFCIKKAPKDGYVLVYNLNRNKDMENAATIIARKKGLRVVNFADTFEFINGAENRLNNDAYDFINYISNADYVVTDSFHGTAFSINFNRQVICLHPPKYSCRLESILRTCKCTNRMAEDVETAVALADIPMDYDEINVALNMARERSYEFLEEAILGCE